MRYLFIILFLSLCQQMVAQEIFYVSEHNSRGRDIIRISPNGDHKKLTTSHQSAHYPHNNHPKLSPDRKKIAYQSDPDRHDFYSIWTMNLDGSDRKRLTQNEGMFPTWSTDGKTIYFSGRRNGSWEILSVPAAGGKETNITQNRKNGRSASWGANMAVSADAIYFSYVREKVLYRLDLSTGQIKQLSSPGERYTHPVLSPDGSKLAVSKRGSNGYDLISYDIQSGKEELIASSVVSYAGASWSADGQEILFTGMVDGNQQIFRYNLKTKKETQLTNNNSFNAMPIW